jgi:hypothetical protein
LNNSWKYFVSQNPSTIVEIPELHILRKEVSFLRIFWDSKQEKSTFCKRSDPDKDVKVDSIYPRWVRRGEATAEFYQIRTFCHKMFNSVSLKKNTRYNYEKH